MLRSFRWAGVLVALVLVAGACGKTNKIDPNVTVTTKKGDECVSGAIGGCTTTTAKAVAAATTTTAKATATTTRAVAAPTTTAAVIAATIYINDDTAGPSMEPNETTVAVGSTVRFTNRDVQARQIKGHRNEFVSPVIKPGASWEYKTTIVGTIQIDETDAGGAVHRPYSHAYIHVAPRS